MALGSVDKSYAKARVATIDAQIKELREQIKRLQKKRGIFVGADTVDDSAGSDEQLQLDDDNS